MKLSWCPGTKRNTQGKIEKQKVSMYQLKLQSTETKEQAIQIWQQNRNPRLQKNPPKTVVYGQHTGKESREHRTRKQDTNWQLPRLLIAENADTT